MMDFYLTVVANSSGQVKLICRFPILLKAIEQRHFSSSLPSSESSTSL